MSKTMRNTVFAVCATAMVSACSAEQTRLSGATMGGVAGGVAANSLFTGRTTQFGTYMAISAGAVAGLAAGYVIADQMLSEPATMVPPPGTVVTQPGAFKPRDALAENPDTAFYQEPKVTAGYHPFGRY